MTNKQRRKAEAEAKAAEAAAIAAAAAAARRVKEAADAAPKGRNEGRRSYDAAVDDDDDTAKPQLYYLYQQQAYAQTAMLFGREQAEKMYQTEEHPHLSSSTDELRKKRDALKRKAEKLRASAEARMQADVESQSVFAFRNLSAVVFGSRLNSFCNEKGMTVRQLFKEILETGRARGKKSGESTQGGKQKIE